ncbi:flagellin lysine-N-methylase [Thermolongibacillus altinsuensis]
MKKQEMALYPEYLKLFSCIGSECEDTCCAGWRVDIDKATYKKYKKVKDRTLVAQIDRNISRNRSNPKDHNYAHIKMDSEGKCLFLTEDRLCSIQLRLGEEFLCDTCYIYPRSYHLVNGVIEKSATLSCPEITRLALLNEKGIEFEQSIELLPKRLHIGQIIDTHSPILANDLKRYFWELRAFSIEIVQNRSYSIAERLIFLGLFLNNVQKAVDDEQIDQVPNVISKYRNIMLDLEHMKSSFSNIPTNYVIQLKMCKELVDYRFGQGVVTSKRYLECLAQTLQGLEYVEGATIEQLIENYKDAYHRYYLPFIIKHEYILENYLVDYMFKNLFPVGKQNVFDDYVMLVIHYAMIKLHLIGMARFHRGLNKELVLKLIQSFTKVVDHNSLYLSRVYELLKKNEFTTISYMAILINN